MANDLALEKNQDEAVAKIGQLLLKGWILLNEACARDGCNLPLVCPRDQRDAKQCVACGTAKEPLLEAAKPETAPARPAVALERERRDEASRKMGEYLLKGWILTDEPCRNGDNMPCMRHPQTGELQCLYCEGTVAEAPAPPPAAAAAPTSTSLIADSVKFLDQQMVRAKEAMMGVAPTDTDAMVHAADTVSRIARALGCLQGASSL